MSQSAHTDPASSSDPAGAEADLPDACYHLAGAGESDGIAYEEFDPTRLSASAWGPNMQHGGPVSALLVRAIERGFPRHDARLSRFTVEILGQVPVSRVRVGAWVERPGRRIELMAAQMQARQADGTWMTVATGRAWRLATSDTRDVVHIADSAIAPPEPDAEDLPSEYLPKAWLQGFVSALRWQLPEPMMRPGVATVAWIRMRTPLVAGEERTPLEQLAAICDVANGVGSRLDARDWTYLNTDTTVHLFGEPPAGWLGVQAETSVGADGIALSAGVLHSSGGPVARVAQTVLVQRRPERVEY